MKRTKPTGLIGSL